MKSEKDQDIKTSGGEGVLEAPESKLSCKEGQGLGYRTIFCSSIRTLSSKRYKEKINKARSLCVDAKGRLEGERITDKKTNHKTYSKARWQQTEEQKHGGTGMKGRSET